MTSRSAPDGSGRRVKRDPEGAYDEAQCLAEPLVGHPGLSHHRPGQVPRAFATQRGTMYSLLG